MKCAHRHILRRIGLQVESALTVTSNRKHELSADKLDGAHIGCTQQLRVAICLR